MSLSYERTEIRSDSEHSHMVLHNVICTQVHQLQSNMSLSTAKKEEPNTEYKSLLCLNQISENIHNFSYILKQMQNTEFFLSL